MIEVVLEEETMEMEFHAIVLKDARATMASVMALIAVTAAYVN
jgi:hypothetical protein